LKPNINSIFDWLNQLTSIKSSSDTFSEEDWSKWNTYMVHRFVSMNPDYIELVNYVQTIPYENKKQVYNIYKEMLPKKQQFFRYIKANKKMKNRDMLGYVSKYFECSIKEADDYISLLKKKDLKNILTQMGIDEKDQKKLLKK
tara:strand:+ start:104 stop:532 length:429 start_codon:yes stop_codon:yes gene_type:complete